MRLTKKKREYNKKYIEKMQGGKLTNTVNKRKR